MVLTLFWVLEEVRNERFLGLLHELHNALLDGILVLVEPTVDVVLHLYLLNNNDNDVVGLLAVFEVVFLLSVLLTCETASHHLFVSLHYRPSDEQYMMLICQVL